MKISEVELRYKYLNFSYFPSYEVQANTLSLLLVNN